MEDLYCFNYQDSWPQHLGWNIFDMEREFERQGAPNEEWNASYLNTNYEVLKIYNNILSYKHAHPNI